MEIPCGGLFQYYLPDGQFQHQISSGLYDSGYVAYIGLDSYTEGGIILATDRLLNTGWKQTKFWKPCIIHEHTLNGTYEPLLRLIRKQVDYPFRHKGAGIKGQNDQGSGEREHCNQGVASTIFVSKKASESKPLAGLDL